jgi:hypothetical protein
MTTVSDAIALGLRAGKRRAMAEACRDPIRRSFELDLACDEEAQAATLLMPREPLQKGLGDEIVPRQGEGLPGVELALKEPDLLNAEASKQRAQLLERCNALELGIETAQETQAGDTVQKMLAHQMAAAHVRAMTLLDEAGRSKDPDVSIRKSRAAARLMDAFSRAEATSATCCFLTIGSILTSRLPFPTPQVSASSFSPIRSAYRRQPQHTPSGFQ